MWAKKTKIGELKMGILPGVIKEYPNPNNLVVDVIGLATRLEKLANKKIYQTTPNSTLSAGISFDDVVFTNPLMLSYRYNTRIQIPEIDVESGTVQGFGFGDNQSIQDVAKATVTEAEKQFQEANKVLATFRGDITKNAALISQTFKRLNEEAENENVEGVMNAFSVLQKLLQWNGLAPVGVLIETVRTIKTIASGAAGVANNELKNELLAIAQQASTILKRSDILIWFGYNSFCMPIYIKKVESDYQDEWELDTVFVANAIITQTKAYKAVEAMQQEVKAA